MPALLVPSLPMGTFMVFSSIFVSRYLNRFILLDKVLYFALLLASLSSVRHIPLWFLVALPLTTESLALFRTEIGKIPEGVRRFRIASIVFVVIVVIFCLQSVQGFFFGVKSFGDPDQAIVYLKQHPPHAQVFAPYHWGGYLLWKYPEKKVFIDGRMSIWRWDTHLDSESGYALEEYNQFLEGKISFTDVSKKYHISTLLLPIEKQEKSNPVQDWMNHFLNQVFHLPIPQPSTYGHIIKEAQRAGWKVVYRDRGVIIYEKP
jgi:hypothetical protein